MLCYHEYYAIERNVDREEQWRRLEYLAEVASISRPRHVMQDPQGREARCRSV